MRFSSKFNLCSLIEFYFQKKDIFCKIAHIRQIPQDTRNSYFNNAPSVLRV